MSRAWGTRAWFEHEFRAAGEAADPWGHEWRASQKARHTRLARLASALVPQGGTVLDVGCAYGALTARLAQAVGGGRVVGLDLSAQAVRVAARRVPGVCFTVAALPDLPLAVGRVDLAVVAETIYYLPGPARAAAVSALWRVLKPGGVLLFSTVLDDGARYFTPEGALALLAERFEVRQVHYSHDGWVTRWETPWLALERRLGRGWRVLTDDAALAAWQSEHSSAGWLKAVRRVPLARGLSAWLLRGGQAGLRWWLGWGWPVRLLAFLARLAGRGRSEVVVVAVKMGEGSKT